MYFASLEAEALIPVIPAASRTALRFKPIAACPGAYTMAESSGFAESITLTFSPEGVHSGSTSPPGVGSSPGPGVGSSPGPGVGSTPGPGVRPGMSKGKSHAVAEIATRTHISTTKSFAMFFIFISFLKNNRIKPGKR